MTQFGHMLGQALGNEIILGTVRGFSDLFDAAVNALYKSCFSYNRRLAILCKR